MTRQSPARLIALVLIAPLLALGLGAAPTQASHGGPHGSYGWLVYKRVAGQPVCTGLQILLAGGYFDRSDCGSIYVTVANTETGDTVKAQFIAEDGTVAETRTGIFDAQATEDDVEWRFPLVPGSSWPPGRYTIRVAEVDGETGNFGENYVYVNQLGADVNIGAGPFRPGDDIPVSGTTYELDETSFSGPPSKEPVAATFKLRVTWPDGTVKGPFDQVTAGSDGAYSATIPGSATTGLTATAETNFRRVVSVEAIDMAYNDASTGSWRGTRGGAGAATILDPPTTLIVENSFVSAVGWVKPGDSYPFRVFVRNFTESAAAGATVTIPAADGTTFTAAEPLAGSGTASIASGDITWNVGAVPAAVEGVPAIMTLVVQARADTTSQDPQVMWKDLSSTATLTYTGGPSGLTSKSHGPKVIPPGGGYETARYGDRPFPVVPVDYRDRKHQPAHTGEGLAHKINSTDVPGSTFNLWQENSYGQLFPNGTVPSAGIANAGWTGYAPGYQFSSPQPSGACYGTTAPASARETSLHPSRISGGWYQLPGDTAYYGGDRYSAGSLAGAIGGIPQLLEIDDACGPTGKAVYDAAQIADPEIDYNDYDTDKDGVVDFFMMVFAGEGGNGVSQTSVPPYDNIWPHSSSLELYYTDANGLKGYVSDDQLKSLTGVPQCWTDAGRTQSADCAASGGSGDDSLPVPVRVGRYNVNPESSIDKASVISHEYGHSLGLPDFYSLGSRQTYGTWNLMATDRSQNLDIFSKQELGWIVPRVLDPGETVDVTGWEDSKNGINSIEWETSDGTPYTLTGPNVRNGEAYVAKLSPRQIIDPAKIEAGASPTHVWWSQSGNRFGCPPTGGRNLDVYLPELETLPSGTDVTLTFNSLWDIEWDFDYGFVMVSTDGGKTYESLPSENGYTTPQGQNPHTNSCQAQHGDGITGSSKSYEDGTQEIDRLTTGEYRDPVFLEDEYDLSEFVGEETVLRFSYSTDSVVARPGWFIDDLKIAAGDTVLYETDFEDGDDLRLFSGGCRGTERVAAQCTAGWQYVDGAAYSPADHAYYLEMRDRSSFDFDGKGEDDRGNGPTYAPGLLLVYTDEAHGYGNFGATNPPPQTPLDSQPQPGNDAPNLDDAAWTAAAGDNRFSDSGDGHTDNYTDPANPERDPRYASVANPWRFRFDCLTFDVRAMTGDDVGPPTRPGNLQGDVRFTMGAGCAPFNYGHADPDSGAGPDTGAGNAAPKAVPQSKPINAAVGQAVTFDGSASFDDRQAPNQLRYEWDFDGDGDFDATGQVQRHQYDRPGSYPARLKVTDLGGLTDVVSIAIEVTGCGAAQPGVNQISGGAAGETLVGTVGNDLICGLGGNDVIRGLGGDDVLLGGEGRDVLRGGTGNDTLIGETGADQISGQKGTNRLVGGPGKDRLSGGPGRDRLRGGKGFDRVHGGPGPDRCGVRGDRTRSCRAGRRR